MYLVARLEVGKSLVLIIVRDPDKEEIPTVCDIVCDFDSGKTFNILYRLWLYIW